MGIIDVWGRILLEMIIHTPFICQNFLVSIESHINHYCLKNYPYEIDNPCKVHYTL